MVPSEASNASLPATVGGAVAVCIFLVMTVMLIVMVAAIAALWRRNRKWSIAASNGLPHANEYPTTNPLYTGKVDSPYKTSQLLAYVVN